MNIMGFFPTDVGAQLKGAGGISPVVSAIAVEGEAIDRIDYQSCVVFVQTGDGTGDVEFKLEDSHDGSTGWETFEDYVILLEDENLLGRLDVNLGPAKRFIRVVATPTGEIALSAVVALGGAVIKPADRGIE
jgi:hypothetical protein